MTALQGAFRYADPPQSKAGAQSFPSSKAAQAERIHAYLLTVEDATRSELERALGIDRYTVSSRLNRLSNECHACKANRGREAATHCPNPECGRLWRGRAEKSGRSRASDFGVSCGAWRAVTAEASE